MHPITIDPETQRAARAFLDRIGRRYDVAFAILYGSRANGSHRPDSDTDIAVVVRGEHPGRCTVALDMAETAFEVLLDTGTLVEALPLWEHEFEDAEQFGNPALIENIRLQGIRLGA